MSSELLETVKGLPIAERIELIQEIWGTIQESDYPAPSADEVRLAESRFREYEANPSNVVSLDEVKSRFQNR